MKGVEPYTIKLRYDKCFKGKRVNEDCPDPDIHYPAEDITPDNAEYFVRAPNGDALHHQLTQFTGYIPGFLFQITLVYNNGGADFSS